MPSASTSLQLRWSPSTRHGSNRESNGSPSTRVRLDARSGHSTSRWLAMSEPSVRRRRIEGESNGGGGSRTRVFAVPSVLRPVFVRLSLQIRSNCQMQVRNKYTYQYLD